MWNIPDKNRLEKIPKLYETEHVPLKEKDIYLHFFMGGCSWYIAEYDPKKKIFWGYISFAELKALKIGFLEVDYELERHFYLQKAKQVYEICVGNG